jgi:multiple sugar transport system substrate-binding protein
VGEEKVNREHMSKGETAPSLLSERWSGRATLTRAGFLKRAAMLGVSLSGASALLAACGGQGDSGSGGQESFEGQTLNVLTIQPHAGASKILKKNFEKATGATVNFTVVPYDQVRTRAALDVQSGASKFDVFDYWYASVGELADQGVLEDISGFIEGSRRIDAGDFIQSIYDPYTLYNGRRYGLPFDGDSHILFYNTEIFDRNDVSPPTTWEEYLEAAKKITQAEKDNGVYGCALLGQNTPFDIGSSYTNRLAGFGGEYLSGGKPALDSDAAVAAAEAMVAVAPYALPAPLQTSFNEALPAFLRGRAAMVEFWTDLGVYAQDPQQSKVVDKWDVSQLPVGGEQQKPVSALNAGFGFAVSAGAKNADLAREFVTFATGREMNLELVTTTGSGIDPVRKSVLTSERYKKFAPKVQKAAQSSLNGALALPTIPQAPELINRLGDNLALMLQGEKDPERAVSDTQEAWLKILEG